MGHSRDWNWADVKAAVEKRGESIASIARANGLSRATLCMAKTRWSPRAQLLIARALRLRPEQIWPRRYADRARR
ncbi:MAG: helix-turn-helix domain-containing protein [Rhizomicrobium sp.]